MPFRQKPFIQYFMDEGHWNQCSYFQYNTFTLKSLTSITLKNDSFKVEREAFFISLKKCRSLKETTKNTLYIFSMPSMQAGLDFF